MSRIELILFGRFSSVLKLSAFEFWTLGALCRTCRLGNSRQDC